MKISYRREMKHNYLILDPEALMWRNYECRMLSKNMIDGVLPFQLRQIDDEIRFYYEITSRQPLSRMLENHLVREREIRQLILGISGVLDRMEQYLLRENIVLLEPDYIYVEPETFRVWLCLVPGLDRGFPEEYGKLLEYLLGRVDHQDKESVVLAYGLYQETRKENYGMDDILRLMASGKEKTREEEIEKTEEMKESETTAERTMERPAQRPVQKPAERSTSSLSFWQKLKAWLDKSSMKKKKALEEPKQVPWESLFREEQQPESRLQSRISECTPEVKPQKGIKEHTEHISETKPQNRITEHISEMKPQNRIMEGKSEAGRNTTLLADFSGDHTEIIRKLCALEPGLEDIMLPYFPFIIGKQKHLVDYFLDHETVSRLHARIDRTEDSWLIQDLNSSNGTMVGGKLLENNEFSELRPGDEVRIAGLRYQFQ